MNGSFNCTLYLDDSKTLIKIRLEVSNNIKSQIYYQNSGQHSILTTSYNITITNKSIKKCYRPQNKEND